MICNKSDTWMANVTERSSNTIETKSNNNDTSKNSELKSNDFNIEKHRTEQFNRFKSL